MSHEDSKVEESTFKEFIKNVQKYLDKDKNIVNLVDKLCQRMKNMKNKKE